jgi:hypothetical protein
MEQLAGEVSRDAINRNNSRLKAGCRQECPFHKQGQRKHEVGQ